MITLAALGTRSARGAPAPAPAGRGQTAATLKVLAIDDEPVIRKLLRLGLTAQGYKLLEAANGKIAITLLSESPDLVILDLGLPDIDGLELLRKVRNRDRWLPIVVLTSRGDELTKVKALEAGADDYLTKPFEMDELLARMRAALSHRLRMHGDRPVFRAGDLSVDPARHVFKLRGEDVKLTPTEHQLLCILVQHAGKILTHRFLMSELRPELADVQYLRVFIRQLRQKIEPDPGRPQYILTESGIGYRFRSADLR